MVLQPSPPTNRTFSAQTFVQQGQCGLDQILGALHLPEPPQGGEDRRSGRVDDFALQGRDRRRAHHYPLGRHPIAIEHRLSVTPDRDQDLVGHQEDPTLHGGGKPPVIGFGLDHLPDQVIRAMETDSDRGGFEPGSDAVEQERVAESLEVLDLDLVAGADQDLRPPWRSSCDRSMNPVGGISTTSTSTPVPFHHLDRVRRRPAPRGPVSCRARCRASASTTTPAPPWVSGYSSVVTKTMRFAADMSG